MGSIPLGDVSVFFLICPLDKPPTIGYNTRMNGTTPNPTKRLYDDLLRLLREMKSQGNTELMKAHQERLRKMGWNIEV